MAKTSTEKNGTGPPPAGHGAADSVGNGAAGGKACVVIPTTGGLVWILGLKDRGRLKSSYAVLENDFRQLKLSKDYHQFVSGPLTAVRAAAPVSELTLSENIDTGRSWEFPTLTAHLLRQADRLVFPDRKRLERDLEPGCDLVWATGMLDPELSPVAADYKLSRKLELSRPLFEACRRAGRKVDILLCSGQPADELQMFADTAHELGLSFHKVANLEDICRELRLRPPVDELTEQAAPDDEQQADGASATGETGATDATGALSALAPLLNALNEAPRRVVGGLVVGALIGLFALLWALSGSIGSGPSITDNEGSGAKENGVSVALPKAAALTMEQLLARDRNDCLSKVMSAGRLKAQALKSGGEKRFLATGDGYLCGLRFRNDSSKPLRLKLDPALESYAIIGNGALFIGRELRPGKKVDLYLSRPPGKLQARVSVTQQDKKERRFAISFGRTSANR